MKTETTCFLCGRPCTMFVYDEKSHGVGFYECPSCGNYGIDKETQLHIRDRDDEREKASHLAAEWCVHKKPKLVLCENSEVMQNFKEESLSILTFDHFIQRYPKDSIEILDRTLLNLSQLSDFPGKPIIIKRSTDREKKQPEQKIAFSSEWSDYVNVLLMLMHVGLLQVDEYKNTFQQLSESIGQGHKTNQANSESKGIYTCYNALQLSIVILPKGLERIRALKSKAAGDHSQAFVAMWFDPSRDKYFSSIEKAATEAGFDKCLRIDQKETNEKICDEIIAEIRKSQCLIADFTGNRGGIYFEAGFALGLGIPVIWLVDANWWNQTDENGTRINDLHFDTRQYAHIDYKDENDLYERLKARIAATIPIRKS